jgi:hypothetical protein
VIALQNRLNDFKKDAPMLISEAESLVDFVWTIDGYAVIPSIQTENQLFHYAHTARPKSITWAKLTQADFKNAEAEYYRIYDGKPVWSYFTPDLELNKVEIFSTMIGMISLWLSRTFGKTLSDENINDYYLRRY